MGTDAVEIEETLPFFTNFKVHRSMCTELMKLVERIANIFPEVEAARPRCSSGIQALCSLNGAIERARQFLQYCCESSKLYLAITGDVMVSRCQRSRNLLEQSLGQIQTMVPVMLAAEISQIIDDLRAAIFVLDPSEEEAGKAVRELIQQGTSTSDSVEYSEIKALQLAASRLHITSPKAILIEKRSIKKLLDKIGDSDPTKKKILKYLLYLLKKYGNMIMGDHTESPKAEHEGQFQVISSSNGSQYGQSTEGQPHLLFEKHEAQTDLSTGATVPDEFKCFISKRLMYDPVVIASGQTFERMWVQKWFGEGNDTCPKTKVKLAHCSLTPNTAMKDLISKWCEKYGITIPEPCMQAFQPLDISSTSIASLGSSMNDLHLPLDISNISLGSLEASYSSDSSRTKITNGSNLKLMQKGDDSKSYEPYAHMKETDTKFLSRLSECDWESQCKLVEEMKCLLHYNEQVYHSLTSKDFVEPLVQFLRGACEQRDVIAQNSGSQLLLAYVSKNRSRMSCLHEDVFRMLVSMFDSEVTGEVLAILEVLSGNPDWRSRITASGALVSILKVLDSQSKEFHEQAIRVLDNLSLDSDICSQIVSLQCIPKLVPFISDSNLGRYCIVLLKNLCDTEEARVSVAETNGCISSIAELLESGSREDQEHAVAVLLSLCSQRVQYCHLVMEEGVIPSLVDISINGSDKGKVSALELLRQLRDIEYSNEQVLSSDHDAERDGSQLSKEKKSPSKTSGFFRMNLSRFSKPSALSSKKKR